MSEYIACRITQIFIVVVAIMGGIGFVQDFVL